ncbi:hypothetical protein J6590_093693 [Homalodisca vitripennis]|nr:hypothetical protein J6590_093693 [Homalodisca vitripennis]
MSIKCKNNNRKPKHYPLPVSNQIPFESVVIEGDSHVRHIAGMTSQLLFRRVSVTVVCKPGARLLQITSSQPQQVTRGTRCSVLIAGTNDLAVGEQRNIYDNLEKRITSVASHNRLIVATLPHRHDLPSTHDINQHTALVNAYIEELAARHHISVLDMNRLQRKHFTRHGMHLHTRGKWQLARLIVETLCGMSASTAAAKKAEEFLTPALLSHQCCRRRRHHRHCRRHCHRRRHHRRCRRHRHCRRHCHRRRHRHRHRHHLTDQRQEYVVMGDFNIDALDNTHHSTVRLVDLLRSFDLELFVKTPTRVTATTQSAIDNIITNHPSVAVSVVNTAISDHYGQEAVVSGRKLEREPKINQTIRDTRLENIARLNTSLSTEKCSFLHSSQSV